MFTAEAKPGGASNGPKHEHADDGCYAVWHKTKAVFTVVLFVIWGVCAFVFLVGVATLEGMCVGPARGIPIVERKRTELCGNELALHWFLVILELFIYAMAIWLAAGGMAINNLRPCLVHTTAICTALLVYISHQVVLQAYKVSVGEWDKSGDSDDPIDTFRPEALRCVAAGTVSLCVINWIWIICASEASGTWQPRLPACQCVALTLEQDPATTRAAPADPEAALGSPVVAVSTYTRQNVTPAMPATPGSPGEGTVNPMMAPSPYAAGAAAYVQAAPSVQSSPASPAGISRPAGVSYPARV